MTGSDCKFNSGKVRTGVVVDEPAAALGEGADLGHVAGVMHALHNSERFLWGDARFLHPDALGVVMEAFERVGGWRNATCE